MDKTEASVIIDRPVEEVWKFIMDLSKLPEWNTGVEAKQTSAGPVGVGTTLQIRGSNLVASARIVEFEPNRKCVFEHSTGPLKGSMENSSVENVEGKTRFTRTFDLKFSGAYKLVGPILAPRMKREYGASLDKLKRILESEPK